MGESTLDDRPMPNRSTAPIWRRALPVLALPVVAAILVLPVIADDAPLERIRSCEGCFLVSAHRGDTGSVDSYPENTVEAVVQAAEKGADIVEVDVWLSADGTWWVMHDQAVDRTTTGHGDIQQMTDAELAALRINGGLGYDRERHRTELRVPRLAELLEAARSQGAVVQVSIKHHGAAAAGRLARFVVDHDAVGFAAIRTYTVDAASVVEAVEPEIFLVVRTESDPAAFAPPPSIDLWAAHRMQYRSRRSIEARAPVPVQLRPHAEEVGGDETAWIERAYEIGARIWMTDDLEAAMAVRDAWADEHQRGPG